MALEEQVKTLSQAVVAGSIPAVSYLQNFSLWVTIAAGVISLIWGGISIVKLVFPRHFNAFVRRIDSDE
jgi:hypothetical protein